MRLARIDTVRKSGTEQFISENQQLDFDLNSFWSWSSSELLGNTLRGVLAEYIVSKDVGCTAKIRDEWDAYDLVSPNGVKIEVKSSSYLQSWYQNEYSKISFGIQPTYGWDASNNSRSSEQKRQSDVYVFCVLSHKSKETVNPLNLDQWVFYILPTKVLNEKFPTQKTLSLSSLLKLNPSQVKYGEIHHAIKQASS